MPAILPPCSQVTGKSLGMRKVSTLRSPFKLATRISGVFTTSLNAALGDTGGIHFAVCMRDCMAR